MKNVSCYSANALFWIVQNATSYHLGPFTTSSAGGGLLWQNVVILLGSVTQSTFLRNRYYHIWVNYSNLCNLWTRTSKLFHRVQAEVSNVIFLASCSKVIILLESSPPPNDNCQLTNIYHRSFLKVVLINDMTSSQILVTYIKTFKLTLRCSDTSLIGSNSFGMRWSA